VDADETPDGLLGTLRSELDEDDGGGLHPSFEVLAGLIVTVRTAFTSFRIGPSAAAELCARLRLSGRDGNEWTVGATSGSWYRRRVGETVWQKSPMPLNVIPVEGEPPSWLVEGIAADIGAAEKAAKDAAEGREKDDEDDGDVAADPVNPFGAGAINPFQRKSTDDAVMPNAAVTLPTRTPTSSTNDVGWILEEWEELERETEVAVRPAEPARTLGDRDTDRGPVPRTGSDTEAAAPVERDGAISPDDYFLRPED